MFAPLTDLLDWLFPKLKQPVKTMPDITPTPPVPITFLWDNAANAQHSVRVICDQENLTFDMQYGIASTKNILLACVQVESGFNPNAVHYNRDTQGNILSVDYGISQINSYWNIGVDKPFPSSEYVLANPEACIRFMCKAFMNGEAKLWCSFSEGLYKKYLP